MANPAPGFKSHPEHMITLSEPRKVTVHQAGRLVAESTAAILLTERGYPPRAYVPRADVVAALTPTEKTTHCPFKGDTTYFDVVVDGAAFPNAAWSYPTPFDEMAPITGHVAFDDTFEISAPA